MLLIHLQYYEMSNLLNETGEEDANALFELSIWESVYVHTSVYVCV